MGSGKARSISRAGDGRDRLAAEARPCRTSFCMLTGMAASMRVNIVVRKRLGDRIAGISSVRA